MRKPRKKLPSPWPKTSCRCGSTTKPENSPLGSVSTARPPTKCSSTKSMVDETVVFDIDEVDSELVLSVCNTISVVGPSGKVNHGSVVSAFVHALKNSDVDGPKGQLVSQVAKTDFGKVCDDSPKSESKTATRAPRPRRPRRPTSR